MDLDLAGKSVLITGGSQGIGRGCAEGFAAEGATLKLVSRTKADLEALAEALRAAHGVDVEVMAADLSQSASVDAVADWAGEVDILVNNAGAIPAGDIAAVSEPIWREAWDLKVFGYINMTRIYFARMGARGHGVILNVLGLAGEAVDPSYIAGSAGNASLMAFTRAIGSRSIDAGVRVLAVNPGAVQTERIVRMMRTKAQNEHGDPERWQSYLSALPLGRAASVEEVANVVVFLSSERASYMSGIIVTIDGGKAARAGALS